MNPAGLLDLDLMQALPALLALNGAAVIALLLTELIGGRRAPRADALGAGPDGSAASGVDRFAGQFANGAELDELDALAALIREAEAADAGGGDLPRAAGSCRVPGVARREHIA